MGAPLTTISAKSILASAHAEDHGAPRIDTLLLRYPRWIHAEGRTHRLFSLGEAVYELATPSVMEDHDRSINASSSRAIPVKQLIQDILDDPAIPLFWGANQKGMQADLECNEEVYLADCSCSPDGPPVNREEAWLYARDQAIAMACSFAKAGYHKQIVNRLLEPFSHINVVVTSTNWSNFLHLRDHKDAEPHIQLLAREIRKAIFEAPVQKLRPGEWHLPWIMPEDYRPLQMLSGQTGNEWVDLARKLSVARCASASYTTVDGFDMTPDRAQALHDKLVGMDPLHASPCEHQAQVDVFDDFNMDISDPNRDRDNEHHGWRQPNLSGNLAPGWVQYRKTLKGECR
jgi:hypothetical protein